MTAKLIFREPEYHRCEPWLDENGHSRLGRDGDVVECSCGQTYVYDMLRVRAGAAPGLDSNAWRRESRRARRRRERRMARFSFLAAPEDGSVNG